MKSRMNFKIFLEINTNGDTKYQNLWGAAKSLLRWK
jgi:hypothetical protein